MKKVFLLISLSTLLWTCDKDKDPEPDLGARISFLWDISAEEGHTYYVIVSDTAGTILQWAQIENNKKLELPYPADEKLAVLTFINRTQSESGSRRTKITTITNVPAGDYAYTAIRYEQALPDSYHTVQLHDLSNFYSLIFSVAPDIWYSRDEPVGNTQEFHLGLYDKNPTTQLLISLTTNADNQKYKYLYIPDINAGEETVVSADSYENIFVETPSYPIDYPEVVQQHTSFYTLYGRSGQSLSIIYNNQFSKDEIPVMQYPDLPGMFNSYETVAVSGDETGAYYTAVTSDEPLTSFTNLKASIDTHEEVSTRRISLDLSGEADVIYLSASMGQDDDPIEWLMFTPMASRIRVSPPQFLQEHLNQLPNLMFVVGKDFDYVSIDDYKMTYNDFVKFKMRTGDNTRPDHIRSKIHNVRFLNGSRVSSETNYSEVLKRYGKKFPSNK